MKIYLSGPMRGYPNQNHAAFDAAAAALRAERYVVVSPPEISRELRVARAIDPDDLDGLSFEDYLRQDFRAITEVDAVAVLDGWERSIGARMEVRVARDLKLPVLWARALIDGVPAESPHARVTIPETALEEAQRLVHGDRGADYGHPYDNDRRIAGQLRALFGWPVKVSDVWRIVAAIKLSRESFRPKRDNRVDLAGYAETGNMVQDRIAQGWPDDPYAPIPANLR